MDTLMMILSAIWSFLNSAAGVTLVVGGLLALLQRLYAAKPAWAKYEGAIVTGIKLAEKQIPDDTPNRAMARADAALRYVIKVYTEAKGRAPSAKTLANLRDGIGILHADLETAGNIKNPSGQDAYMTAKLADGDPLPKNAGCARMGALAVLVATVVLVVLVSLVGCTSVVVAPGAGPVNVGTSTAAVALDGQETAAGQNAPAETDQANAAASEATPEGE